jgi:hypothetical protein
MLRCHDRANQGGANSGSQAVQKAAQQASAQLSKVWQELLEPIGPNEVMQNLATLCDVLQPNQVTPTASEQPSNSPRK